MPSFSGLDTGQSSHSTTVTGKVEIILMNGSGRPDPEVEATLAYWKWRMDLSVCQAPRCWLRNITLRRGRVQLCRARWNWWQKWTEMKLTENLQLRLMRRAGQDGEPCELRLWNDLVVKWLEAHGLACVFLRAQCDAPHVLLQVRRYFQPWASDPNINRLKGALLLDPMQVSNTCQRLQGKLRLWLTLCKARVSTSDTGLGTAVALFWDPWYRNKSSWLSNLDMCAIAYDGDDHRISFAITIMTIIMTIRVPIRFCCFNPKN